MRWSDSASGSTHEMKGTTVVASDIDGTLQTSRRAADPVFNDDVVTDRWSTGYAVTGPRGWHAWSTLSHLDGLVPVTGRSPGQYTRMTWAGPRPRWAILSGGGMIMVDGQVDREWTATATKGTEQTGWSSRAIQSMLETHLTHTRYAIPEGAIGLLCVVPAVEEGSYAAQLLAEAASKNEWLASFQGRKMFLQSPRASKGVALSWLAGRHNLTVCASAGDSALDLPMLATTPTCFVPAASEAHNHRGDLRVCDIRGHPREVVEEIPLRLLQSLCGHRR